jgi:hypothetical protein
MSTFEQTTTICIGLIVVSMTGCVEGSSSGGDSDEDVSSFQLELAAVISGHDLDIGHLGAITADDEGRVFALDTNPLSRRVLVVNAEGELSHEIGRPGEGPGEFANLRHALSWNGDALLVLDPRTRRITSFNTNGEVLGTLSWPQERRIFPIRTIGQDPYLYAMEVRQLVPGRQEVTERATEVQYAHVGPSGDVESFPALTEVLPTHSGTDCAASDGGVIYPLTVPFTDPQRLRAAMPDGRVARASQEQFRVEFLDPETGSQTHSIEIDLPRRVLEETDWRRTNEGAWVTQYEQDSGGTLVDPRNRDQPCDLYSLLPEYVPAILTLEVDDLGRLWVEGSSESPDGQGTLRAFDTDGNLLGLGTMPERDPRVAPVIRGDKLLIATVDELGVQSIQIHQIVFRP